MLTVKDLGKILEKRDLRFETGGVFNPGCVKVGEITHMFYRAVDDKDISTIGYCQLKDGRVIKRLDKPLLTPEYDWERKGVEDPDITFLDGVYYLFYTAYDGKNALTAYATSRDLTKWVKRGLVSPQISYDLAEDIFKKSGKLQEKYKFFELYYRYTRGDDVLLWEKDFSLFPKKFDGKFALIHRVLPGMQICFFKNFEDLTVDYWKKQLAKLNEYIVLDPKLPFETAYVGGGCPPIETDKGWLLIYHGVEMKKGGKIYHAAAVLLDLKNPRQVKARLPYPLFSPEKKWEKEGKIRNVVFPGGAVIEGDDLIIYYGAADRVVGGKKVNLKNLFEEMEYE